jgi:LysR family transcriptional regulator, glycine cleavage system transcriptional activator
LERLLPLNALRMFAAVGRLLSFSRAANELHVTASAVSHQIKTLENYLGVTLLRRSGGHIVLTTEGQFYLQQVVEGLSQLARATKTLKAAKGERILRISCAPNFSTLWLVPRIARFTETHPDIALALIASRDMVDMHKGKYDLAIRYGKTQHEGFRCDMLSPNELFPVCSPKLMKGVHPLRTPADLRYHALLESSDDEYYDAANPGWQGWLQAAGVPDLSSAQRLSFSPRFLMQQAVVEGLGVGLSRTLLAADFLERRQLICPFGPVLSLSSWYYLVCPEPTSERPDIVAFREWLLKEANDSRSRVKVLQTKSR